VPGPSVGRLGDGRLHLQYGPIDIVITVEGDGDAEVRAEKAMEFRFRTILDELVDELPLLRADIASRPSPRGDVARRMVAATSDLHSGDFATSMVAVAGAVADTIADVGWASASLRRLIVNNGGDIAIRQVPHASTTVGVVDDVTSGRVVGRLHVAGDSGVGGVATSGWGGRSVSFGVADAVTVIARTAAEADVAASLIANAVDVPGHPAIERRRACDVKDDSDLGERLVTCGVGALDTDDVDRALDAGVVRAELALLSPAVIGVILCLQERRRFLLPSTVTID
jgi:ApbE superfamily uncharacterized protein (UPF0280 family)